MIELIIIPSLYEGWFSLILANDYSNFMQQKYNASHI